MWNVYENVKRAEWKLSHSSSAYAVGSSYVCQVGFEEVMSHKLFNTLRPRQDDCHFADDISKRIFFNENVKLSPGQRQAIIWTSAGL